MLKIWGLWTFSLQNRKLCQQVIAILKFVCLSNKAMQFQTKVGIVLVMGH